MMEGVRFSPLSWALVLLCVFSHPARGLNLDADNITQYTGPEGSYFGFSVDFHQFGNKPVSVVVGAPKANTSQPGVTEGGAVFLCSWSREVDSCEALAFDRKGNEQHSFSKLLLQAYKSHQWLGATVRSRGRQILACAPLFHWNVVDGTEESENTPVGNCQLLDVQTEKLAEYAPCKDILVDKIYKAKKYASDRRYCEAGFSSEITKDGNVLLGAPGGFYFQGQVIVANINEIIKSSLSTNPMRYVKGQASVEERYYDVYQGYSVATGEFTGDATADYVAGVPNDQNNIGSVKIYDGNAKNSLHAFRIFYGSQVTSYFGHTVAVTDINNDGRDDILVGAPLFMERQSSKKLHEVGQVSVYLQQGRGDFSARPNQVLTGHDVYGRFGSAIAPLGDIDHDGFNDVAVGAPFSGVNGRVFIFMGQKEGVLPQYTQVLESPFQPLGAPAAFGFTLRGGTDIDGNGYPDLIVGAWGASKIAIYRAQAVVRAQTHLSLYPDFLNPDAKHCQLPGTDTAVSCFTIRICVSLSGHQIPEDIVLNAELHLDKMKQKMAVRTLFLLSKQPQNSFSWTIKVAEGMVCKNQTAYLREESEFKDKLSPIFIALNYSLEDSPGAVLHGQRAAVTQTRIILDCGEDNMCVPDLRLTAKAGTDRLLIGDENPVLLVIGAENRGEGAYETELKIRPPPDTHYQGLLSNREGFHRLVCAQKKENGTLIVVCDLGNPMSPGQKIQAGLYFSVSNLEEVESHVSFQMQIKSKNSNNPDSNLVELRINVIAMAALEMRGGSSPAECVLPIANWEARQHPKVLEDIGPLIEHVYELRNLGPATVNARVEVKFPTHLQGQLMLYVFSNASEERLTCETQSPDIDTLKLVQSVNTSTTNTPSVHRINKRQAEPPVPHRKETVHVNCSSEDACVTFVCVARGLERGSSAVVKVSSRLWVQTFLERPYEDFVLHSEAYYEVQDLPSRIQPEVLPSGRSETHTMVVWKSPDGEKEVPVWVIVVAVIAGLLLLAVLSCIFWKIGFFKRNRPPSDDDDTQELQAAQPEYAVMQPKH